MRPFEQHRMRALRAACADTSESVTGNDVYAERGDVCIGFIECRCARCLVSPAQQEAKRRLAKIREANRG